MVGAAPCTTVRKAAGSGPLHPQHKVGATVRCGLLPALGQRSVLLAEQFNQVGPSALLG